MRMTTGLYGNMHTNLHKNGFEFTRNESRGYFKGCSLYIVEWRDKDGNITTATHEFYSSGLCIVCDCHPRDSQAHAY